MGISLSVNTDMPAVRSSNLELYRIVCMLLIVAHHYVVNSGLMDVMREDPLSPNSIYLFLFGMWGKTGINCFLMITGYFMCTSKITWKKFLKLYLWVITYGIIINLVFILSGRLKPSLNLLFILFPFRNIHSDSFVSTFLIWWLFIPFLNVLVNNLNRKQHGYLILLTLLVFSVYPFVPKYLKIDMNPICWFSTLYFVASYLRKYPENIYKSSSAKFWGWLSVALIIISMVSVVVILWHGVYLGRNLPQYYMVSDSQQPLAFLVAVSTFMWFKNLNISYNKYINAVGASVFGVLLIHANSSIMRQWLWNDTIDCVGHYALPFGHLVLYSCISVLAIFTICVIIDRIRLKVIEEPFFRWYDKMQLRHSVKDS